MEDILKTCLHQKHLDLGAKMMPFGGFDMPIEYTTIIEEHNAVRHAAVLAYLLQHLWVGKATSYWIFLPSSVLWVISPSTPMRSQLPLASTCSFCMSMS